MHVIVSVIKPVILMTLDVKNCSCEKPLIGKLVLECEYEILNKTKSSFNNKKVNAKNNCLTRTASLVIICLLLLTLVCFSCYFYMQNIVQNRNICHHLMTPSLGDHHDQCRGNLILRTRYQNVE